ncbi:MAG: RnfABCDGE type electron transport complex subunit D, partial [Candidatus Bathyarchaeota archaeon]|nr:RnfABCDGE type electron transport complex subunit D [Candidatus Bathyarchaeota archaeon]
MRAQNKKTYVTRTSTKNRELIVEPSPHVTGRMTKDLLMKYTFVALCIIAAVSYLSYGFDSIIISAISVLVAVTCDYLLSLIMGEKG